MSKLPLISVVIIFWNAERFFEEALASVFAQTYQDWELLLVDDGSADASRAIARRIAKQYPERVRYLGHPGAGNHGMSASRNLGIRHARGEYIAFLDADDVWFPQTLQEQVAILEFRREAAMVYGPLLWWYSWTGALEDRQRDYIEKLGVEPNAIIQPSVLLPLFLQNRAAVPSGLLVRHEVIERLGGFEEAFRGEYEDQVFCVKVCLHAPIFAAGKCWYKYRQHPHSCVSLGQQTGTTLAKRLLFLEWLEGYLREQGVTDPAVWQAVRCELWPYRHRKLYRLSRGLRYFIGSLSGRLRSRQT